jgi:hypothetical protein
MVENPVISDARRRKKDIFSGHLLAQTGHVFSPFLHVIFFHLTPQILGGQILDLGICSAIPRSKI